MSTDVTKKTGPPRALGVTVDGLLLIVSARDEPNIGRVIKLTEEPCVIGRAPDVTLQLDDEGLSRKHCAVSVNAFGQFWLSDLNSTNGTFLNGVRITTASLFPGDKIQIGENTVLRFGTSRDSVTNSSTGQRAPSAHDSERTVPDYERPPEPSQEPAVPPPPVALEVRNLPLQVLRDEVARVHAEYVDLEQEIRSLPERLGPTKKRGILSQAGVLAESICKLVYRDQGLDGGMKEAKLHKLGLEHFLSALRSEGLPPEDIYLKLRTVQGYRNIGTHDKREFDAVDKRVLDEVASALVSVMHWLHSRYLPAQPPKPRPSQPPSRRPTRASTVREVRSIVPHGDFLLIERLGVDDLTESWLARPLEHRDTPMVLVRRPRPQAGVAERASEALVREARALSQLKHPNIPRLFQLGRLGAEYFCAIEHQPRVPLQALMDRLRALRTAVPGTLVRYIIRQVLEAVVHAHELRVEARPAAVRHGRISPHTILCLENGGICLDGFGRARAGLPMPTAAVRAAFGATAVAEHELAFDVLSVLTVAVELLSIGQTTEQGTLPDARSVLRDRAADLFPGTNPFRRRDPDGPLSAGELLSHMPKLARSEEVTSLMSSILEAHCGEELGAQRRLATK